MIERKKVLITGVYGLIGGCLFNKLAESPSRYDVYGLDRNDKPSPRVPKDWAWKFPSDHVFQLDLSDANCEDRVKEVMRGVDTVVHLAADSHLDSSLGIVWKDNVRVTQRVFKMAGVAGVKRVVFASSMAVLKGHVPEKFAKIPLKALGHRSMPFPTSWYALSKLWGEHLTKKYSAQYSLSCLCVRVGAVKFSRPERISDFWSLCWCGIEDIVHLLERSILADKNLNFEIFHGVSDASGPLADMDHTRRKIGYIPQGR